MSHMSSEITEIPDAVNGMLVDFSPDCVKLSVPYAKGARVFFLKPGEAESFAASLTFAANGARQLEARQLRLPDLASA